MDSWSKPRVPALGFGLNTSNLSLTNSRTGAKEEVTRKALQRMYVCGITPYDATHLGHAATYVTFDLINRYLLASGAEVNYVQNITDVDDPLLERARRDSIDWRDLAHSQVLLFASDMEHLRVIPPTHYIGAVEAIPLVVDAIQSLQRRGAVYAIDQDYYFSNSPQSGFGELSHLNHTEMEVIFAQRGGDPTRAGKLNSLDCLVWMSQREGEPGWPSTLGAGRPGWHIECTAIALKYLSPESTGQYLIDIQGGGSDLIFPHHEMCRAQAMILTGKELATNYVHAGMIGLNGEKMSKSEGNLVLVSSLIAQGADPRAIRYALLTDHYRKDRMWSSEKLESAQESIRRINLALSMATVHETKPLINEIIDSLADDLDTPRVLRAVTTWVDKTLDGSTRGDAQELKDALDSLLGLQF
ncbi:MAG: cysteine--1-D-myo-inosityl 2-amino-2-deoxy-alpha-D-glucopyranoside ligase [Actinomycetota bacterium]|nr:cysteine--1-D-myo-inosityl 2-amino-2-deoxy-alpha-D-glucopyranoside ligase [Actinomycetota bacterium]